MNRFLKLSGQMAASCLLMAGSAFAAAPTFSLTQAVDAAHPTATSVTIQPGQSFTVNLGLAANNVTFTSNPSATYSGFNGISTFLNASSPGLSVASETPGITTGSDPLTFQSYAGSFPVALPTSGNTPDLGYLASNPMANVAPGSYTAATYNISTSAGILPGTYTIGTTKSSALFDAAGNEFDGIAPVSYTINVTPEPACMTLLAMALCTALPRRRGRQSR